MKIDRQYHDMCKNSWDGKKTFSFKKVNSTVGSYEDWSGYYTIFFELESDEIIGRIYESDNRSTLRKSYYNAQCQFGWDGKKKTRKEFYKSLCTRADYETAKALMMEEYKARKAQ